MDINRGETSKPKNPTEFLSCNFNCKPSGGDYFLLNKTYKQLLLPQKIELWFNFGLGPKLPDAFKKYYKTNWHFINVSVKYVTKLSELWRSLDQFTILWCKGKQNLKFWKYFCKIKLLTSFFFHVTHFKNTHSLYKLLKNVWLWTLFFNL